MKCPSCGTENPSDAKICTFCATPLSSHTGDPFGKTRLHAPQSFDALSPGDLIANRYQIVRELGRGGMGVVYLVRDQKLQNKQIALKLISPFLVKDDTARQRFVSEVMASQEMTHGNIVKVFHLDEQAGHHFFTMEYLSGNTLREWIVERQDKKPTFSLEESIAVISRILSALSHAHAKNVIHRDLKPENIIVSGDFPEIDLKVVDFGLARIMSPSRLTSSAMSMGTAYYMSPEQLAGKGEVDERSDIFSVGVILYELLTGKIPTGLFKLPSVLLPGLPGAIDDIVGRSLATDPIDRFQNVRELQTALHNLLDKTPRFKKKSRKTGKIGTAQKPAPSRKAKIVSVIGVLTVLIVASLMVFLNTQKPDTRVARNAGDDIPPVRQSLPGNTLQSYPSVHLETPSSSAPRVTEVDAARQTPPVPAVKKFVLTVRPDPTDATIKIVNKDIGYYPGIRLEPDDYHIRVSKSGYRPYDKWISIKNEDVKVTVELAPMTYAFTVKPDPSDASVRILNIDPRYYDGMRLEPDRQVRDHGNLKASATRPEGSDINN